MAHSIKTKYGKAVFDSFISEIKVAVVLDCKRKRTEIDSIEIDPIEKNVTVTYDDFTIDVLTFEEP